MLKTLKVGLLTVLCLLINACTNTTSSTPNLQQTIETSPIQQELPQYLDALGITIKLPSTIFLNKIGETYTVHQSSPNCFTTLEFTTAPALWKPPYYKILADATKGEKTEYQLNGIKGTNVIMNDGSATFYGEISSEPSPSKVLMVHTSEKECQNFQVKIIKELSAH